jgi:tetratricopeptide (TPR) repeat protein
VHTRFGIRELSVWDGMCISGLRRYPPSVFWGSKPAFRVWWGSGRAIAAISAGVACAVTACGGSSSTVPAASIATTLAAGSAALRQRDYWGAEQLFLQVIKRDPSQAAAYYDLGLAYQDRHDYRDALRAYAKAQALDRNFVPVIFNRAVLYSRTDPQLAMFLYRRAIALQHDSPTAYLNLGLLEAGQGPRLHRQAEKDLAKAVRLDPSLAGRIPSPLRSGLPAANRSAPSKAR